MSASSHSIAVIGAGSVGSAIAFSLLLRQVAADIILVDIDQDLCNAQVQDLRDATFLSNIRIRQGTPVEAAKAAIIIVTAGAKQRPGDTRLDLIDRNFKVLKSILSSLNPINKDAILLLVANPVDILTSFAQKLSGLPRSQVLGSGTVLDSVRLRAILAEKLQVSDSSLHAFVVGEHGDSQCVAWSCSALYGTPLLSVLPLTEEERNSIEAETRQKAENIIKVKGFTSYGVAAATSRICESIIFDQRQVLTISHWQEEFNCCLSVPTVVGRAGVVCTFPLKINEHEMELLKKSAKSLGKAIENVEKELEAKS